MRKKIAIVAAAAAALVALASFTPWGAPPAEFLSTVDTGAITQAAPHLPAAAPADTF